MKATPIEPSGSLIGVPTKAPPDAFHIVHKYTGGRKRADDGRQQIRRVVIAEKLAQINKTKEQIERERQQKRIETANARIAEKEREDAARARLREIQNAEHEAERRRYEVELATKAAKAREFQVMSKIAEMIYADFRLKPDEFRNTHCRTVGTVARQLFSYIVRKHTKIGYTPIANFIGAKSHSASHANDAVVTNAVEENLPCHLSRTLPEKFWGMGWRELAEHFDGLVGVAIEQ